MCVVCVRVCACACACACVRVREYVCISGSARVWQCSIIVGHCQMRIVRPRQEMGGRTGTCVLCVRVCVCACMCVCTCV